MLVSVFSADLDCWAGKCSSDCLESMGKRPGDSTGLGLEPVALALVFLLIGETRSHRFLFCDSMGTIHIRVLV